ncbi:protein kinase [Alloacidobacterium dinghuense]|uniref:Protein kinase n=1 Tax=Alloacidobacterium dinghuense TaxID=2763107 RepID=A0A7G8BMR6_9BACT|nr:serine/threonine-protein kinase [Alloacidobacterium dinghuense]QNI33836.1 protein kinase [Alloacidobacterium dinghuense]
MDDLRKDNLVGQVLLHYQVTERLGEGGMGVVYRAVDLKLKRTVALKFLPASQAVREEVKERFMREALASSALDHTNIGTLYSVEETTDRQLFLVMACYEGPTLAQKMARGPMSADDSVAIALQACRGLSIAHKQGVVHRDIKPSNLIFNSQGVLKILDFGLAKLHGSPELTAPGSTLGTAAYMAPEQAMGNPADQRADLWSVGVVLYEMLKGRGLFNGSDLRSTIYAVVSKEPEPIPRLPGLLQEVLSKALQKDPERRYQTADEMIAALEAVRGIAFRLGSDDITLSRIGFDPTPKTTAKVQTPPRRRWLVSGLVALVLVAAAIGLWIHGRRAAAVSSGKRIAALPLMAVNTENAADASSTQALADGLRSQLIAALVDRERDNQGLWIVPAAQLTAQHVTDPAGARRTFGADLAITGSLAVSGEQLRIVLSSVDTATSKVLASEVIEGTKANLPALSQKMARASTKMLGLKSGASSPAADPLAGLTPADANTYMASIGYLENWDKSANLDAAITGLEQVTKTAPNFALGFAALADCYRRRYETTKDIHALELADQNVSHAMQIRGDLPDVVLSLGEVRLLQGRYSEALSNFERVVTLDDRNDRAYRGLAKAYAATGLPDKAEETWQKAVALRPNSADAYTQLGLFELYRSNYAKAVVELRRALSLAPANARYMSNLGVALLYAGSLAESRKVLQDSIRVEPNYAAYTNLGNLDLKQGRYAEAAADYENALEINKSDYHVWSNLAVAYSMTPGQKERAKDGFLHAATLCREALKANPNDAGMLSDLAMFVASEGDERQEPLVLIERALALAPQDTDVQFNAAETYESLGYRKEALDWVAKLITAGYPLDDINQSPVLADLVKDKRYQSIVQAQKK